MSFILIIVSVSVGFGLLLMAGNPSNASGIIDGATITALFVGGILLFVWAPVFLTSITLAIKAIHQGDQWGYACLFAHVVIIGGVCSFSLIAKTLDTPERRAAQQQKWLERRASRQAPRPLGGIDISRDSTLYKVAASPWLLRGSLAVLALGLALRAIRHRSIHDPSALAAVATPCGTETDPSPLDATCPVCHADIGRVLISGGKVCPSCNTAFLQQSSADFKEKGVLRIGAIFQEGSSVKRVTAAVLAGGLLFFTAAWVWYWALGDAASSTPILMMAALLAVGLAAMLAVRVFADQNRTG